VRAFIVMNLFLPALFSAIWMLVLGGTALQMDTVAGLGLTKLLGDKGPESLTYFILEQLPAAKIVIPIFLGTVFLSYVTAADSNTMAMAGISSTGMTQDSCEPKLPLKIIWGAVVGILALVMICTTGVDGIKMISNLGGLPALFFELAAGVALLIVAFNPARYCVHEKALLAKNQSAPDELVADAPLDRTLAEPALP
jgi:choline-glycine betaine transporter